MSKNEQTTTQATCDPMELAREELPPELYSPEFLTEDFRRGLDRISELLDRDVESICDSLENEDLAWEIAWGTMCDDEQCPHRLLSWVLSPLRTALRMLEDHRSEDPAAARDASIQKVRASIKAIRILSANDHRLCGCTLEGGRLTLVPCLLLGLDHPTAPIRGFAADEIEWAIRDALDLDIGPAIKRCEKAVDTFVAGCGRDLGFAPAVTVDWDSFRAIDSSPEILSALKRLRDDLLGSVHYALFHLKKELPLPARLDSLRFRHVASVEERSITLDGKTLAFCVPLIERSTSYSTEQIQERIAACL